MTSPQKPNLLLVGCGKMGDAMLQGWVKQDVFNQCLVVDPSPNTDQHIPHDRIHYVKSAEGIDTDFTPNIVIFAIKPQMMEEVAPQYKIFACDDCVFLSIAAGTTLQALGAYVGSNAKIVRSMPNTPAAIGAGATVITPNIHVTQDEIDTVKILLNAVGKVYQADSEDLMDAVTAVSGSGPAYVFLLIETMAKAGVKAGLPEDLAQDLARQTVIGAANLAQDMSDTPPTQLRKNVTSPGGTTAAALDILMADKGMQALFDKAIDAAKKRSKELS